MTLTETETPHPPTRNLGLQLRGITKRFGHFTANDAIDLDVLPGEIHCLLGENGAGKSTLMNVLYGLLQPEEGTITVDGAPYKPTNPKQAMAAGIGMVHQHFMLVPVFTVAENMVLGHEPGSAGFLNRREAASLVTQLSERYHFRVRPDDLVEDLPVGVQQRVEILKALARDAKYIIFDEPTAVLTPQEIDDLMAVMTSLRDEGRGIVFITHKLREVREIADRITVIRRGKIVGSADPGTSEAELAELMVGRAITLKVNKRPVELGADRLVVSGLSVSDAAGTIAVDDISFAVRGGEILGIAGVQGNGQTELASALIGTTPTVSGTISMDGTDITRNTPKHNLLGGLGFVPEDRTRDGFVGSFSVAENLVLNTYDQRPYAHGLSLDIAERERNAQCRVEEFDIRTQSIQQPVGSLSGGNQQKVILARELSRPLKLLVANQPTRGVDVGAIEFLHDRIVAERESGAAILIISTELDEVVALSDRIAVMYRGKIVGTVPPDTGREVLGLMMAGVPLDEAKAAAAGHIDVATDAPTDAAGNDAEPAVDERVSATETTADVGRKPDVTPRHAVEGDDE